MTVLQRISSALIALTLPLAANATAPAPVFGIRAEAAESGVLVSWNQIEEDIAHYRIFYASTSILGNEGRYDDFETVDGSVNSHTLQNLPPSQDLYVAILAVNAAGEESPYFLEEAHVSLGGMAPPAQTSSSAASTASSAMGTPVSDADTLMLLSVEAVSATGVLLRFNLPVTIDRERATSAIVIQTGSGVDLALRRYVLEGPNVTVHTDVQQRDTAYKVTVSDAVQGRRADGATVQLDSSQQPMLFIGHAAGKTPDAPGTAMPEAANLRLNADARDNGTYAVQAAWQAPAGADVAGYLVAQTTDGGKTYSVPQNVSAENTAVNIPGVPGGIFGVMVRVRFGDGSVSRGITQFIDLPAPAGGMQGDVTGGGKGGSLPSSGPALTLATAAAAMGAWGWRGWKVKKLKSC